MMTEESYPEEDLMSRAILGAALAAGLLAASTFAAAQSKMVIKASDVHPPG